MNQQCKVCGEPAAGFHFGAFTCEGCKSFFGRSYNNLSSITECKNNGECAINKKNRTACKACRLRKCLLVGMSKSGSRYGRRSNWFKIHCLLQEQQQAAAHQNGGQNPPQLSPNSLNLMGHPSYASNFFTRPPCTKEELMLLGLDEYSKHPTSAASPSISSPDSHNSESSIEIGDKRSSLLNVKHQNKHQPNTSQPSSMTPLSLNKDLFLPMQFGGLPFMPPPGFHFDIKQSVQNNPIDLSMKIIFSSKKCISNNLSSVDIFTDNDASDDRFNNSNDLKRKINNHGNCEKF